MSIVKETAIAVPALALLLIVGNHVFGPDESYRQLAAAIPTSWLGVAIPDGRFIAKDPMTGHASLADVEANLFAQRQLSDLTPEARIRSVFAQFEPGARRRAT